MNFISQAVVSYVVNQGENKIKMSWCFDEPLNWEEIEKFEKDKKRKENWEVFKKQFVVLIAIISAGVTAIGLLMMMMSVTFALGTSLTFSFGVIAVFSLGEIVFNEEKYNHVFDNLGS
jgi:hypothetical protein